MGNDYLARLIASRTQKLHGTHLLDGYYQQRSMRRVAAIHRIGEVGPNPHGCGGMSHETEPRLGGTVTSKGRRTQCSRGKPGRQSQTRGTRKAKGQ